MYVLVLGVTMSSQFTLSRWLIGFCFFFFCEWEKLSWRRFEQGYVCCHIILDNTHILYYTMIRRIPINHRGWNFLRCHYRHGTRRKQKQETKNTRNTKKIDPIQSYGWHLLSCFIFIFCLHQSRSEITCRIHLHYLNCLHYNVRWALKWIIRVTNTHTQSSPYNLHKKVGMLHWKISVTNLSKWRNVSSIHQIYLYNENEIHGIIRFSEAVHVKVSRELSFNQIYIFNFSRSFHLSCPQQKELWMCVDLFDFTVITDSMEKKLSEC